MLEKVIHEDSTRYIVESLQDGMNKRKTASVYTPALATLQVKFLVCLALFAKVGKLEKLSKALDEINALRLQYFRQYLRNTRPAGTLLQSRQFCFSET